jgi:hypothetical protein
MTFVARDWDKAEADPYDDKQQGSSNSKSKGNANLGRMDMIERL